MAKKNISLPSICIQKIFASIHIFSFDIQSGHNNVEQIGSFLVLIFWKFDNRESGGTALNVGVMAGGIRFVMGEGQSALKDV